MRGGPRAATAPASCTRPPLPLTGWPIRGADDERLYTFPRLLPVSAFLLAGRLPSQYGIHDWLDERRFGRDWLEGEVNLAELLQSHGPSR